MNPLLQMQRTLITQSTEISVRKCPILLGPARCRSQRRCHRKWRF